MRRRAATLDRAAGARLRATAIERLRYLDELYGPPGGLLDAPCMGSGELRDKLDALEARGRPVRVILDQRHPDWPDPAYVPDEHRLVAELMPDDRVVLVSAGSR